MKLRHLTKLAAMPLALLSSQLMANGTAPIQPSGPQGSSSAWSVYAGFGGGYNELRGKRTDLIGAALGAAPTIPLNSKTKLSGNNGMVTLMAGLQWSMNQRFALAIEPYFSYGKITSSAQEVDVNAILRQTKITSKQAWGVDLKPSYNIIENGSLFALLGMECRKFDFDYLGYFTNIFPFGPNLATAKKSKNLRGFSYGIGYEHKINNARVGLRFKHTRFSKKTLLTTDTPGTSVSSKIKPNVFTAMLTLSYNFSL